MANFMAEVLFRAKLQREGAHTPWGFRLQGGVEYNKPLTLLKVQDNSIAARSGLHAGDIVVKLAGKSADDMTHKKAQQAIVSAGNELEIIVERADVTIATSSDTHKTETAETDDDNPMEKKRTKNGPKIAQTGSADTEDLRNDDTAATSKSDSVDGTANLDTNANKIAQSKLDSRCNNLRETKPPLDTVISSPDSHRKVLNLKFAKQKDDSLEGSTDSSGDSSADSFSSHNAQNPAVISDSDSNSNIKHVQNKTLSYMGWSSTSSDSDDSISIKYPSESSKSKALLMSQNSQSSAESQNVKDSKYPWRRARNDNRRVKLHVRSVSEPARSTQPPELIGPSSLPKKSISVANLSSSDTKSYKSAKSSLASVSEEVHEDKVSNNCDFSSHKTDNKVTSSPPKRKLVKQNATEDIQENNAKNDSANDETRKLSNSEYTAPTANDIYFAAKDPDVKELSLPQVKGMVADLNNRLETIAVNHPKLVQPGSPSEFGLSFAPKSTQDQKEETSRGTEAEKKDRLSVPYIREDSSSSDEKDIAMEAIPHVERERSLDGGALKQSQNRSLSPNPNQLSKTIQNNLPSSGASSPQIGRKVHFADPPESKVIEIEPSERRRRKALASAGERRREDKYPEFYKNRELENDLHEESESLPLSSNEDIQKADSKSVENRETITEKVTSHETSIEEERPKIPEIAYASSSVRELAERLDRIERENELFRNNREPDDSDKPIITKDITGRTYTVTPNPVTPTSKDEQKIEAPVSQESCVKERVVLKNVRPSITVETKPQVTQARSNTSVSMNLSPAQQPVTLQTALQPTIRRTSLQPAMERSQVSIPQFRHSPSPQLQKPANVPIVSIARSYSSSPSFQPSSVMPNATVSQTNTLQVHQVQASPRQVYSNLQHTGYAIETDIQPQPRYQPDHLSAMPTFHSSPQNSPARSPVRSPNRSPVPPQPRHSPVSQAELEYYKQRLFPQESPPPYSSAVRSHDIYRRFHRRNSTGGVMLSTSNLGPGRGFSFSIDGHGGPINVSFTQQRAGDPATQVAFQIPREAAGPGQPSQITYSLTPDVGKPGDSVSFNYTTPQYQPTLLHHRQGGSYDDSKVIQISYPPSPSVAQQRRLSPNSIPNPDYYTHQDIVQRQDYLLRPVKPEPQYPVYNQHQGGYAAEGAIPRTSPRTYLSPPVQQTPPPPPYPYTKRDLAVEDTSALSQSKSFKNLENKFLLGGNLPEESSQLSSLTSDSCRKPSGVSMQENRVQVPQPAASARPYIPPLPEHVTLDDLDLEAVERRAIERHMKERLNISGEALSTERTPPGLFAFFDKSFSEKLLQRQFRRKPNYGQSETFRLVKEMDEQQRYEGNQ